MADISMEFHSDSLNLDTRMMLFIPQKSTEKPKVLYLLHGLCGNCYSWIKFTGIERMCGNYAVVMPEVGRSFYTDTATEQKYWTFIADELPAIVSSVFNVSAEREKTFVMGYSMGGYGAVKLALNRPERFKAAVSLSGAVDIAAMGEAGGINPEWSGVFGTKLKEEDDLPGLVEKAAAKPNPVKLFLSCGRQDFLYGVNQGFKKRLDECSYPYEFEEFDGDHGDGCSDERMKRGFDFLNKFN